MSDYNLIEHSFLDELAKIAADLTQASREKIKPKNFAIPKGNGPGDTGKYPIHDEEHASNALTRVRQHGTPKEKSQVYAAVAKKYPGLASRSSIDTLQEKAAATQSSWVHPQTRSGRRSLRVDTLLRKDKDGSLYTKDKKKIGEIVKEAIVAGAGMPAEYVTNAQDDQGSAVNRTRWFPSKDDQGVGGAKRQDMREFAANEPAMGTFLFEMGPQPIEKTSSMRDELVKIALSGRLGKALEAIGHAEGPIEVGGLGILAAPSLDNMQAKFRARRAGLVDEHGNPTHEGVESKRLIAEDYHDPIEAGGLGILASPYLARRIHTGRWH